MGETYHQLSTRADPALLSLVIPAYNEEEVLPLLRAALTPFIDGLQMPVEVILINDGSTDRTLDLLLKWASDDQRIKVLALARNFGHQMAATAGLDAASGDAAVILDADLQDPLEVIPAMLERYRQGYDVVYGQRTVRQGESGLKRLTAWAFYRLMRASIHPDLPLDTGDFRLISRPCLDALAELRETHRFLRGMVAWVGFPQIGVPYSRPARAAGQTKYPLRKMLKFAWTAAISFSTLPLRLSLSIGVVIAVIGIATGVMAVIAKLANLYTAPGWASQMVIMSVLSGAILISNGILGEYVGRIFEEIKGRPLYVISRRVNLPAKSAPRDPKDA